nr:MAG TPA: hypothetical protein [Caudoviricetes sp.]
MLTIVFNTEKVLHLITMIKNMVIDNLIFQQ